MKMDKIDKIFEMFYEEEDIHGISDLVVGDIVLIHHRYKVNGTIRKEKMKGEFILLLKGSLGGEYLKILSNSVFDNYIDIKNIISINLV